MTLKVAYFQPTILAIDDVLAVEFSRMLSLVTDMHSRPEHDDSNHPGLSIRGGQQVHVYPNPIGIDVLWLVYYLENLCKGYMDIVTQQSGKEELKYCKPLITSIWTIRQQEGDYQEMHSHPDAHLSGNIYITAPDINEDSANSSDGQILFQLPQNKDIRKFVMQDVWKYKPIPGTVIVFPSHVPHTVYPWKGPGFRTVMAFDAKLVPLDFEPKQ
jgi:hypothetical protein